VKKALNGIPKPRGVDRRKRDEDVAERISGGVRASYRRAPASAERADDRPAPTKPPKS
jgi:hypothetical protein